ncbi:hypothetical protein ACFOLD_15700 [Kocuria carniphila]|uniref:hypothetical protein n=1 Tax=Kocuria carniphila TaxID=262208 RepID=UPI0036197A3A
MQPLPWSAHIRMGNTNFKGIGVVEGAAICSDRFGYPYPAHLIGHEVFHHVSFVRDQSL